MTPCASERVFLGSIVRAVGFGRLPREKDSVFFRILVAIRSYFNETEAAPDILKIIKERESRVTEVCPGQFQRGEQLLSTLQQGWE